MCVNYILLNKLWTISKVENLPQQKRKDFLKIPNGLSYSTVSIYRARRVETSNENRAAEQQCFCKQKPAPFKLCMGLWGVIMTFIKCWNAMIIKRV
jgi:hypothetical protein